MIANIDVTLDSISNILYNMAETKAEVFHDDFQIKYIRIHYFAGLLLKGYKLWQHAEKNNHLKCYSVGL